MRTFVVDVNGRGPATMLERDLDRILKKYDMEKVRVCDPAMYGILENPFPTRLQYAKKMSWLKSLMVAWKIGRSLKYSLFLKDINMGWAID